MPAQPSTTTPAASANTWRWSSRPPEPSSGPRYLSTCWRSRGSLNKPRMCCSGWVRLERSHVSDCVICVPVRGEKNFHIFYYIYAGLYRQNKLKTYRLPDRTPPRSVPQWFPALLPSSPSRHGHVQWSKCAPCRYIDSQHRRVMQDIVSSKLYTEQFDAIQECFRNIGFTEEVLWYPPKVFGSQMKCCAIKFFFSILS